MTCLPCRRSCTGRRPSPPRHRTSRAKATPSVEHDGRPGLLGLNPVADRVRVLALVAGVRSQRDHEADVGVPATTAQRQRRSALNGGAALASPPPLVARRGAGTRQDGRMHVEEPSKLRSSRSCERSWRQTSATRPRFPVRYSVYDRGKCATNGLMRRNKSRVGGRDGNSYRRS